MCSSASGVGTGVGSGVAVGAVEAVGPTVGAALEAAGVADAVPVPQAAMIGASAAAAPRAEMRCRSWRRVSRSSAR